MNSESNITCIVLAKNEEKDLANCLASIQQLAKRVVVVDSGSTDKTIEVAKRFGADIYFHEFEDYARQFNWAIDNTNQNTKWIYRIDADEIVPPDLMKEILEETSKHDSDDITGLVMKFKVFFLGRWIKHGGVYPFFNLTIFKRGYAKYSDRAMGEHLVVSSGHTITLKNDCEHHDFKDLTSWVNKHNWYSTREVVDYFESMGFTKDENGLYTYAKKTQKYRSNYYRLPMFFRAKLYYIYRYYFKFGFLDGKEGKIYCWLQAYWYRFLVDSKIYEAKLNKNHVERPGSLK